MEFKEYWPIWDKLTAAQQQALASAAQLRSCTKGEVLHGASKECTGLFVVCSGQLRAYTVSEEGRELTLYRLFERDICLFSASCMMRSLQVDITVQAEKDSTIWVVPAAVYQQVMAESAPLANYTNEIMASRFSDVMWLMDQVMWKSMDKRLAGFLLEEAALEGSPVLALTHETIGSHLGSPREVITRLLRYLQADGLVKLSRGTVEITDARGLEKLNK